MPLTKKKPVEPLTYDERLHALAAQQGWPSVSLDLSAAVAGSGLPADVPPLPGIAAAPAEVDTLKARVAELAEQAASFEAELAVAYETGDSDAVLDLRRRREEATVERWAAEMEAVTAELAWYEAEMVRVEPYAALYDRPLEALRLRIRDLQDQEQPLVAAVGFVTSSVQKLLSICGGLEEQRDRLRRGPTDVAVKDGWR